MSDERKRRLLAWLRWAIVGIAVTRSRKPQFGVSRKIRDGGKPSSPAYAPVDWLFENCEFFRESMRIWAYPFSKRH